MRVALVHDYIKEFGGAERVLKVLSEMYPEAPIYTAFSVRGSAAEKEFRGKVMHESWLAPLLKIWKLYSPLRFLIPLIWSSFDLSDYDVVITSASWYITRGFKVGKNTKVICYCHTPPRWLYGYETSVGFTKYWPVKVYSAIVGHFLRMYDFKTAQPIKFWIANSENVKRRIGKFYRKEARVIYPPVEVKRIMNYESRIKANSKENQYFLIVSRLVGAKGLEEAAEAADALGFKLKIAGEAHGFSDVAENLKRIAGENVELLGRVSENDLYQLYAGAKGFIALAKDEDFGMTVVEAQAAGTPVIAYNGGGYKETVIDGKTGILVNGTDAETLKAAMQKFSKITWNKKLLIKNALRFSKEEFIREMRKTVIQNNRNIIIKTPSTLRLSSKVNK